MSTVTIDGITYTGPARSVQKFALAMKDDKAPSVARINKAFRPAKELNLKRVQRVQKSNQ
jgi:hypothetical protein